MTKFIAILQLLCAVVLGLVAAATLVNMVLIAQRPETISVVNALIGQIIMLGVLAAASHILVRRGMARLRGEMPAPEKRDA